MADKRTIFHSGSRKAFVEESYVMDAVQSAKNEVATRRHGQVVQGSALFKSFARLSAAATVHPLAVDIVNAAVGVEAAAGHAASVAAGIAPVPPTRSGIAQAQGEVAESLRRLGVRR